MKLCINKITILKGDVPSDIVLEFEPNEITETMKELENLGLDSKKVIRKIVEANDK